MTRDVLGLGRGGCIASRVLRLLPVFIAAAPALASAFNSDDWLGKREVLGREAERLQSAYACCVSRLETPAENVTIPIENHPDGSVKSVISASAAQLFLDTGFVWGTNVVVRQMATNGVVEAEVAADSCVVDRQTKSGWAAGHAKAVYRENEVEGDGIYFSFPEEYATIYANTQIRAKDQRIDTSAIGIGGKPGKGARGASQILARRTDFDRQGGVLLFDGDVRVSDSEYSLGADRLFVFLDGTNSLKRIVADGSVTVTNGARSGSCAHVTYVKSAGRVVMYGDKSGPARLVDDSGKRNEVEGRRITFWLDSEQVEVEGSTLKIEGGALGGQGKALKLLGK